MSECTKHVAGRRRLRIVTDRRAAISLIVAASLPVLIGVMAFGIDISYWTTVRIELQRTADIAAMAGAAKYASTYNSSKALTTAANIAELNGFPIGSRTGDGITTLTDQYGAYTATFTFTTPPVQITATVHQSLSYIFAAILASGTNRTETISATAVAQTFPRSSNLACVVALDGYSTGVTTTPDLTISGGSGTNISMSGCDLRSDASIAFNGSPGVAVPNLVASGGISGSYNDTCTSSTSCDQQFIGVPQIPNPFANSYNLSVPASTIAQPQGTALGPPPPGEAYQSLDFGSGTYTLSPGIYYVSGSVTFDSNSTVSGTGVTIIMGSAGSLTMNGSTTVNLTAPTTGSTAGLLFGSATSNSISFNGNASLTLAGALYTPNSSVTIAGNTSSAESCLSLVALNVAFAGSSSFASSGCAALGMPPIYDYPATDRLVE